MKVKTKSVDVYISDDDVEFDDESSCLKHEIKVLNKTHEEKTKKITDDPMVYIRRFKVLESIANDMSKTIETLESEGSVKSKSLASYLAFQKEKLN